MTTNKSDARSGKDSDGHDAVVPGESKKVMAHVGKDGGVESGLSSPYTSYATDCDLREDFK